MWNQNVLNFIALFSMVQISLINFIKTEDTKKLDWKHIINNLDNQMETFFHDIESKGCLQSFSGNLFQHTVHELSEGIDYEAFEEGSNKLPKWLSFEPLKRTLHGVPSNEDIKSDLKIQFKRKDHNVNGQNGELDKQIMLTIKHNHEPFSCTRTETKQPTKVKSSYGNTFHDVTTGSIIFSRNLSKLDCNKRVELLKKISHVLPVPVSVHSLYLEEGNRFNGDIEIHKGLKVAGSGDKNANEDGGFTVSWRIKCGQWEGLDKNIQFLKDLTTHEDFQSTFKEPVLGWFVHTFNEKPFRYRRGIGALDRTPSQGTPAMGTPTISPYPSVVISPILIKASKSVTIVKTVIQKSTTASPETVIEALATATKKPGTSSEVHTTIMEEPITTNKIPTKTMEVPPPSIEKPTVAGELSTTTTELIESNLPPALTTTTITLPPTTTTNTSTTAKTHITTSNTATSATTTTSNTTNTTSTTKTISKEIPPTTPTTETHLITTTTTESMTPEIFVEPTKRKPEFNINNPVGEIEVLTSQGREVNLESLFFSRKPLKVELLFKDPETGIFRESKDDDWIEYSAETLYILPKVGDVGSHMFGLKGTSLESGSAITDTFTVNVNFDDNIYGIIFNITLKKNFEILKNSAKEQVTLLTAIAKATNIQDYKDLRGVSFYPGSVTMTYSIDNPNYAACMNEHTNGYMESMSNLKNDVKFLREVTAHGVGGVNIISAPSCVHPTAPSTAASKTSIWQRILIPVIVIIILLLVIVLILCCVYHRKRKQTLQMDEDKEYLNNKKPVVFLEEFEEKPQFMSLQPLILQEKKPPVGRPYEPRADTPENLAVSEDCEDTETPLSGNDFGPPPYNDMV